MFMSKLSHFCNISTSLNYFITRSGSVSMRILPYNTCSDEVWYKLFFCHSNAHWHGTAWFQVCSCWFVGFFNSVQLLPENGNVVADAKHSCAFLHVLCVDFDIFSGGNGWQSYALPLPRVLESVDAYKLSSTCLLGSFVSSYFCFALHRQRLFRGFEPFFSLVQFLGRNGTFFFFFQGKLCSMQGFKKMSRLSDGITCLQRSTRLLREHACMRELFWEMM